MREPEPARVSIGIPLPSMTFDQLHDLENDWSTREGEGLTNSRLAARKSA
jgi:hypothetical protein